MVVKLEQNPPAVDAVDLLDASFHNLSTKDEKPDRGNDDDDNGDDGDEDFEAFTTVSRRLKEKEEFHESISSIHNDSNEEKQKEHLAKMAEDLKQGIEPQLVISDSKQLPAIPPKPEEEPKRFVSPKDFELLKVIGMGAFGKVLQVKNKSTKQVLAMKVISKRLLKRKAGYVENIQAERNILTRVRYPFVVMMHCSFQTKNKLFIIMDFLAGGELFLRLGREGIFLEKTAAFYLAEIILALEFLHNLGILHRDLKPENILLGTDGHIQLTDFGLAKDFSDVGGFQNEEDESRASTICGTQEYMAPEMVASKGYGRAADYWSLGCIAYEMLKGLPPFHSKLGAKDLFRKIMSEKVKMPDGATAAACKLLKGLLNRNPHARLGAARSTMFEVGGSASLKKMEFFKHIHWDKLERKEVEPPERLPVKNDEDLVHFHGEFTSMPLPRSVLMESKDDYTPKQVVSGNFRGFSFIQKDFFLPERDQAELENYYKCVEEDGESDSDTASSKLGLPEEEPAEKKRPPRKRKKKKKAGAAGEASATCSVASSEGRGLGDHEDKAITKSNNSATQAPPEPINDTPKPNDKKIPLTVGEATAIPTNGTGKTPAPAAAAAPKSKPQVKAPPKEESWQSVKTPAASSKPQVAKPQQQPYSLDRSKNTKYVPPTQPVGTPGYMQQKQQRVAPKAGGWAGPHQQHFQQRTTPTSASGWTVAHHQQIPLPGPGLPRQQPPPQQARPGGPQPASNAPKTGPAPGSWAAKLQNKPQVRAPQPQALEPRTTQPSTTVVPPSPSTDWRSHNMSPSPKKTFRPSEFPDLGNFPAPPTLQGNKKATTPNAAKPMGAWAAKKK